MKHNSHNTAVQKQMQAFRKAERRVHEDEASARKSVFRRCLTWQELWGMIYHSPLQRDGVGHCGPMGRRQEFVHSSQTHFECRNLDRAKKKDS